MEIINVLLIEDNPADARQVVINLGNFTSVQFHVQHASDLKEGIALLKNNIDIVLLDLELPGSHGLETFTTLRKYSAEIPIVILSGLEDESIAIEAVQLGAQDYLVKDDLDKRILGLSLCHAVARNRCVKSELAREAALEKVRVKSAFLANMSHEIRTPLYGIIGTLDLLKKTKLSLEQEEYVKIVSSSSSLLLKLLSDILDFSMIEANKLIIHKKDFNLQSLVEEVGSLSLSMAEIKKIKLQWHINEDVPIYLNHYETRIKQVLINLVNNAIKFTNQGNVKILVTKIKENDSQVVIRFAVKDTGIGIAENEFLNLFQSFSQIDTLMQHQYCGAGLGLAISKKLVEMMGGIISVESTVNVGSTFWFEIPCEKQSQSQVHQQMEMPIAEETPSQESFEGVKILVVEDNPINQKVISLQLIQLGVLGSNIKIASNGIESINFVKQHHFDLVLMDCQLPQMDGFETTQKIRQLEEESRDVPIIAMTAYALPSDRDKCYAAGMNDFIGKPITIPDLKVVLRKYIPSIESNKTSRDNSVDEFMNLDLFRQLVGSEKDFHKLIQNYYNHLIENVEKLSASIDQKSMKDIELIAHKCFGSSATLGFANLSNIFKRMCIAVHKEQLLEIKTLYQQIAPECEKIKDLIDRQK